MTSAMARDSLLPLDTQLRHLRYGKIPHKFVRRSGLASAGVVLMHKRSAVGAVLMKFMPIAPDGG
jgi:hypothetical protein